SGFLGRASGAKRPLHHFGLPKEVGLALMILLELQHGRIVQRLLRVKQIGIFDYAACHKAPSFLSYASTPLSAPEASYFLKNFTKLHVSRNPLYKQKLRLHPGSEPPCAKRPAYRSISRIHAYSARHPSEASSY